LLLELQNQENHNYNTAEAAYCDYFRDCEKLFSITKSYHNLQVYQSVLDKPPCKPEMEILATKYDKSLYYKQK
jgi:hypothetical protein